MSNINRKIIKTREDWRDYLSELEDVCKESGAKFVQEENDEPEDYPFLVLSVITPKHNRKKGIDYIHVVHEFVYQDDIAELV